MCYWTGPLRSCNTSEYWTTWGKPSFMWIHWTKTIQIATKIFGPFMNETTPYLDFKFHPKDGSRFFKLRSPEVKRTTTTILGFDKKFANLAFREIQNEIQNETLLGKMVRSVECSTSFWGFPASGVWVQLGKIIPIFLKNHPLSPVGVFRIPSCRSSYMNEAPSVVDGVISPRW